MTKIPFYRPSIGAEEIDEVVDTLKSGWLTTGPKTKQFELKFADYLGHKHAIAVNSCTAALHLALEAVGVRAGDTVVVPTMTFAATAEVVRYFNATPLLVDCRESDFNLDTVDANGRIERSLARGEKVTAILPVHYGGQVGDVAGVQALARRFDLKVIEDAAHCCPAYYASPGSEVRSQALGNDLPELGIHSPSPGAREQDGGGSTHTFANNAWQPVGASADITCFSFYANKCITTGEGGMACTQNDEYAERIRIMSLHGISKDAWKRFTAEGSWYYEIVAPGFKYNLTDVAAAIGIHQLKRADEMHRRRTRWAGLYSELLAEVEELMLPALQPGRIHSWHLYPIRLRLDRLRINRAEVIEALKAAGITTSVHWMPLHEHPYYREQYRYKREDLPVASRLYSELITLPLFPEMTEGEVHYVCQSIKDTVAANLVERPVRTGSNRALGEPGLVAEQPRHFP